MKCKPFYLRNGLDVAVPGSAIRLGIEGVSCECHKLLQRMKSQELSRYLIKHQGEGGVGTSLALLRVSDCNGTHLNNST